MSKRLDSSEARKRFQEWITQRAVGGRGRRSRGALSRCLTPPRRHSSMALLALRAGPLRKGCAPRLLSLRRAEPGRAKETGKGAETGRAGSGGRGGRSGAPRAACRRLLRWAGRCWCRRCRRGFARPAGGRAGWRAQRGLCSESGVQAEARRCVPQAAGAGRASPRSLLVSI